MSDARWLLRQRWLHPSRLMRIFPEHKELIRRFGKYGISWWSESPAFPAEVSGAGGSTGLQRAWEEARDWTVMEDRWHNPMTAEVCVAELWYRRWVNAVVMKSPDGRVVEYDEGNPAHVYAVAKGLVKTMKVTVPRVRRSFWLGPHKLYDGASPFTHRWFPYVPFWGFREDTSRVPYGYVRDMVYLQDTLNIGLSRLRWGMSAYRVERTAGAVDMPDDLFREQVSRLDADIVLNAAHMAQPGARFDVKRDFQLNAQQMQILQGAREAIERVNPAGSAAFSGRRGTATSGSQESTQVEQANQALAHMMGNFRRGRTLVGEQLMALLIQDMGDKQETVVIEGDAVRADRTVILNKPETDPQTGQHYLSNDLLRTRLMVALEDVPSTHSYRAQQLAAMSEAVKSLPAQYQAAALPFMASLMDVPFKREMVEALRAASAQETPEQIEQRIQQAIQDDRQKQRSDLKERELDIKDKLADAEVKRLMAQAVQTGVQAAYSAMQGGAQVAMNPQIAPIADAIMQGAGYQKPSPGGADPDIPVPQGAAMAPVAPPDVSTGMSTAEDSSAVGQGAAPAPQGEVEGDLAAVRQNTSPAFPPVPATPEAGMDGIETMQTADNLPA
ncbi:MAG: hypothetical protein J6T92_02385 [Ottowia sp.]|nr:hypothetical protein [Ottowia sp.]